MHIRRKGTQSQGYGENAIHRENLKSFGESNVECLNTTRLHSGTLYKEKTWKRFRHCISKAFCNRRAEKQVPYTSLTHLDRLSISKDELRRVQKKLRFCLKRSEHEYDVNDDELDCCFDSILRERVQRSKSFSTRRMAICKEIERHTEGNKNTSLLELRKTLIINNRFKEMGL